MQIVTETSIHAMVTALFSKTLHIGDIVEYLDTNKVDLTNKELLEKRDTFIVSWNDDVFIVYMKETCQRVIFQAIMTYIETHKLFILDLKTLDDVLKVTSLNNLDYDYTKGF